MVVIMTKKYVMLVDMENCSQCHACLLACKDEHFGNDFPPYTFGIQELGENWVNMHIEERGSGSKTRTYCWPEFCRHCEEPSCSGISKAVSRRLDGVVLIDQTKAERDKTLVDICPNHAIAWNDERKIPQKCTLCAHLLDAGESFPRCVEACPNGTLRFGDLNDPGSEVFRIVNETPELAGQTGAVRFYNNPGRFIAGSVYISESEVAEGADVFLLEGGKVIAQMKTNGFGDFRFGKLRDRCNIQLKIFKYGYREFIIEADAAKDVCLEEITLERA